MRSNEELMQGILQRKAEFLARKQVRRLKCISAVLSVLLVTAILIVPGITGSGEPYVARTMGATILGPETGGYVIVALLAFVLGIITTLLIRKRRAIGTIRNQGAAAGSEKTAGAETTPVSPTAKGGE